MARIIEQAFTIKLSRIVKDDATIDVLTDEVLTTLISTLPTVCEEIIDDGTVIVEIEQCCVTTRRDTNYNSYPVGLMQPTDKYW